jgi:hypothetical protein
LNLIEEHIGFLVFLQHALHLLIKLLSGQEFAVGHVLKIKEASPVCVGK